MGQIHSPQPAKLFVGMISPELDFFSRAAQIFHVEYGPTDMESEIMPWELTDYYRDEMGSNLFRKFIFFQELIDPGTLPKIKLFTNAVEQQFALSSASGSRRRINLDPGYITESKVVLATTKDYSHRIYIGENIYAEVTLRYSSKERAYLHLDHTYFDFRTDIYKKIFNEARDMLRVQLKTKGKSEGSDGEN